MNLEHLIQNAENNILILQPLIEINEKLIFKITDNSNALADRLLHLKDNSISPDSVDLISITLNKIEEYNFHVTVFNLTDEILTFTHLNKTYESQSDGNIYEQQIAKRMDQLSGLLLSEKNALSTAAFEEYSSNLGVDINKQEDNGSIEIDGLTWDL